MAYLQTDIAITALCINDRNIAITNGRVVSVHKLHKDEEFNHSASPMGLNLRPIGTFSVDCLQIFVYDEKLVILGQDVVKIFSLNGVMMQELQFSDAEGIYFRDHMSKGILRCII